MKDGDNKLENNKNYCFRSLSKIRIILLIDAVRGLPNFKFRPYVLLL